MKETTPNPPSRGLLLFQQLLGIATGLGFAFTFLRRADGFERLQPKHRYLFVSNHVSLLDTLLLGGLCWRRHCLPIMVLGDKNVWHSSWIKRLLSSRFGFLLERGKLNRDRIRELQAFGRKADHFNLFIFPEGTRGNGLHLAPFQPGLFYVAQQARLPIVPVFIHNMQLLSSKTGGFHPIAGWRKIEVFYGEPIPAQDYLSLSRQEFPELVRQKIMTLQPRQPAGCLNPAQHHS